MGITKGEGKKGREEIFKIIMTENFPQINVRYQITDPGNSEHQTGKNAKKITTWLSVFWIWYT